MANTLIRVNSSTAKCNVTEKRICTGKMNGKPMHANYAVIEGTRHMIRGSVMNGIHYNPETFDELAKTLMTSNARIAAPVSHPSDFDGNFVSASDPICQAHTIGAFDTDWRVDGDVLVSNTYINLDILKGRDDLQWLVNRIADKKPIDRSTGLLLRTEEADGIGADGEKYVKNVVEILELDHSAILDPDVEPGAKRNDEGVGMFTNASGSHEVEEVELHINAASHALGLDVASRSTPWDAFNAVERIKQFTNSIEKPSTNYRKFFAYFDSDHTGEFESYKLPFADIVDGTPMVIPAAMDEIKESLSGLDISNEDKGKIEGLISHYHSNTKTDSVGAIKSALRALNTAIFGNSKKDEYNSYDKKIVSVVNANKGDREMRDKIIKALKSKGVYKENMSDDEMMAAYENMLKGGKSESEEKPEEKTNAAETGNIAQAITQAVNSALKPLQDEMQGLKAELAANSDKEKEQYVSHVVNSINGMTKEAANAMSLDSVKALALSNGYIAFNAMANNSAGGADDFSIEMPKSGVNYNG